MTQSNVSCNGGNNGFASAYAIGGLSPYTYNWNNGQSAAIATGLVAGNYIVTITDANNLVLKDTIVITQPAASLSNYDFVVNASSCNSNDGQIYATASGGTTPY